MVMVVDKVRPLLPKLQHPCRTGAGFAFLPRAAARCCIDPVQLAKLMIIIDEGQLFIDTATYPIQHTSSTSRHE
jgi:hypothetical protein